MRIAVFLILVATAAAQRVVPPPASQFAPTVIRKVEPHYTDEARRKHIEGSVLLYAEIGKDGRAHRVRVVRGLGAGLDENAVAALREWRFAPATQDGRSASMAATIEIPFHLR